MSFLLIVFINFSCAFPPPLSLPPSLCVCVCVFIALCKILRSQLPVFTFFFSFSLFFFLNFCLVLFQVLF